MASVVEYSEVPLVSSDIIGNPHSSIFDALSTTTAGDGYLRAVSWYDNERPDPCRAVIRTRAGR